MEDEVFILDSNSDDIATAIPDFNSNKNNQIVSFHISLVSKTF